MANKQSRLNANKYQAMIVCENKESIQLEIHLAYVSLEEAITKIKIANKTKESAHENLKIANNKYKEVLSSIIEVTEAQTFFWQNAVISQLYSIRVTIIIV
ncbi:TolC family protein [Carboxylicivirga sp. RSCT41]|uniref:TolC family protein n=1 Tax=Carboxylicivirga agarovorans TaxID=3417570 RepID=UPI003D327B1D